MQVGTTADTAANGSVSRRRSGGAGRVSEGVHKPLQSLFDIDSAGPLSASMSQGWWENWKS